MRNIIYIILTGILFMGVSSVHAQNDSTQYIYGIPQVGGDSAQLFPKRDLLPKKDWVRIPKNRIPHRLKRTLNSDSQYRGWENAEVYFDKNTGLYFIHLSDGNEIWTYSFNRSGKPVTVNVTDKHPEDNEG